MVLSGEGCVAFIELLTLYMPSTKAIHLSLNVHDQLTVSSSKLPPFSGSQFFLL